MATTPSRRESDLETPAGLSRRSMLGRSAAGVGIAVTGSFSGMFGAEAVAHGGRHPRPPAGYGPLIDDPAGLLSLPEGFEYTIVAQTGVTKLDNGTFTPGRPDGTASFPRRGGGSILINNHELGTKGADAVIGPAEVVYDPAAGGGTTTIEVDSRGRRIREYASLAGTSTNCAGGKTPWSTWLSCEETEGFTGQTKSHGWVFEVDPYDDERTGGLNKPIMPLGRFAHEALVVDPHNHTIYLTEDAGGPNGLLYRWTPPRSALPLRKGELKDLPGDAGTFEAMKATSRRGKHVPDLSVATQHGTTYRIEWVTVPDRLASSVSTRKQFSDDQITRSRKLEGMWWGDGGAYFVCSYARFEDGSAAQHDGQVWFLDPDEDTIELKLHFVYTPGDNDEDEDGPDNITVSAYGGLIIAEDGEGKQHLIGATDDGEAFFFARNDEAESAEFTGPNFSPDRKILFACVQSPGFVYAIRGPFRKQRH
jgi:uncharacterized protein